MGHPGDGQDRMDPFPTGTSSVESGTGDSDCQSSREKAGNYARENDIPRVFDDYEGLVESAES